MEAKELAALKRKAAALREAGSMDKAAELEAVIARVQNAEESMPAEPKAYPNPSELVARLPEKATPAPRPQVRRASAKD